MSLFQLAPEKWPQPNMRPPCRQCGAKLVLILIEPLGAGIDQRSFKCEACDFAETILVKFR